MTLATGPEILHFQNEYRFLSNFWPCAHGIEANGIIYYSTENAYQASKSPIPDIHKKFKKLTPAMAKSLGSKIELREDWDDIKLDVMYDLNKKKFKDINLKKMLLATGDRLLVEGNNWGDRFWGQDPIGNGRNYLGKILMRIRDELRDEL